ncbi:MAG: hypothetical protein HQL76_14610 [Magnetococcales bacterium]|nr:hypothetical protein [Magnetococcales bacterium]
MEMQPSYEKYGKGVIFEVIVIFQIIIHSLYDVIERSVFWVEILLITIFLVGLSRRYYYLEHHKQYLRHIVYFSFVLPLISWFHGMLYDDFDLFYSLRHVLYFSYGVYFLFSFQRAYKIIHVLGKWAPILVILSFVYPIHHIIGLSLIGVAVNQKLKRFFIAYFSIIVMYVYSNITADSLSYFVIFIFMTFLLSTIYFWPRFGKEKNVVRLFRFLTIISIIVLASLYSFLGYYANKFDLMHAKYGTLHSYISVGDGGTLWRLGYWGVLIGRLNEYPLGFGIGRPFIPVEIENSAFIQIFNHKTIRESYYVSPAHNAVVTFTFLCGPFFLIPTLFFLWNMPRLLYKSLSSYNSCRWYGVILTALFLNAMMHLLYLSFNPGLETPLHASSIWFSFGLWVRFAADWGNAGFIVNRGPSRIEKIPLVWVKS